MLALLLLCLIAVGAEAQLPDPASVGRGGVHDLSQKFANGLTWNPAVLGVDTTHRTSVEFLSFSALAANNSFSSSFWNRHLAGDTFLTAAEKSRILKRIPANGMQMDLQLTSPLVGLTRNKFGFNVSAQTASHLSIPRDLVELALVGNEINHHYNLTRLTGETYGIIDYALGFGYEFDQEQLPGLYFGIGLHFYQGLYLARISDSEGGLTVTDSTISGAAGFHGVTSNRGDGVGFDLAGMAKITDKWMAGLSLRQLAARLSWDVDENHVTSFKTVGFIVDSLDDDDYLERASDYEDTTYSGGTLGTRLPVIVQLNGRYQARANLAALADVCIRTSTSAQGRAGLEVGAAVQYHPLSRWLVQGGFGVGGPSRVKFGIGTGLRSRHYELDVGWAWNGGLFNSAHGASIGIAQRVRF